MPSLTGPDGAAEPIARDRIRAAESRDSIVETTLYPEYIPRTTSSSADLVPCGHIHGRESHRKVLQTALRMAFRRRMRRGLELRCTTADEGVADAARFRCGEGVICNTDDD